MFRLLALVAVASTTATAATPAALATHPVALPSQKQLDWLDLEVSAMIGWNLQTVCTPKSAGHWPATPQKCQARSKTEGAIYVPTRAAVENWNPAGTDTDEWARVAASFGAKYVVMVADHMTGFTWWDTKQHNYSIAHTKYKGGGGDIAAELIASCKKYGLKLGFFYSVRAVNFARAAARAVARADARSPGAFQLVPRRRRLQGRPPTTGPAKIYAS